MCSGVMATRARRCPHWPSPWRINRPSLSAIFGKNAALFRKVLDRYAEVQAAYIREALAAPTARAVVERLLTGAVEVLGNPQNPRGCLAVQGALACGEGADC